MGTQLESLAEQAPQLRLRKIDLSARRFDAAQQHGVSSLPFLVMYEGDQEVARGTGPVMAKLGY